jgi:hypothetical protein
MKKTLLLSIVLFLLFSCGIFKDKNLAKRYKNRTNVGIFKNSIKPQLFVQVDLNTSLISTPKKEKIKYNVLSLSDKGQEAFINSLNSKGLKPDELIKLMGNNFDFNKLSKPKIRIIPNTIQKTLIFTIDRLHSYKVYGEKDTVTVFNNFGDRVSYLELNLKLPKQNEVIFNSWDKYVTDKITLNLGNVSSAQNWNASVSAAAKGSGNISLTGSNSKIENLSNTESNSILLNTGNENTNTSSYQIISDDNNTDTKTNSISSSAELGGNATIGYTDTYQTSLDLSSEIIKLSGTLSEKNILLRQESGPGIDLSGNIVVSVEYKLADKWAQPINFSKLNNLYQKNKKPNKPADIKNEYSMIVFPDLKDDIKGKLDYKFLYRQVNKGNRHLPEARQKVTFYHGEVESGKNVLLENGEMILIKKDNIRPKGYLIGSNNSMSINLDNKELIFETIIEAANFLVYINDLAIEKIPFTGISLNGNILSSKDINKLKILTTQF